MFLTDKVKLFKVIARKIKWKTKYNCYNSSFEAHSYKKIYTIFIHQFFYFLFFVLLFLLLHKNMQADRLDKIFYNFYIHQ